MIDVMHSLITEKWGLCEKQRTDTFTFTREILKRKLSTVLQFETVITQHLSLTFSFPKRKDWNPTIGTYENEYT